MTRVIEKKGAIFDVDLYEGSFRALKTRSLPWQGPEGSRLRNSKCQATKTGRSLVGMYKEINGD